MSKTKIVSGIGGAGSLIWLIIAAVLGYFVYGHSLSGALAIALLTFIYFLISIIGFVPFVGVILYYFITSIYVEPSLFSFTGIYATWLTSLIFWVCFVFALLYTIIMSILLVAGIID